MTIAGSALHGVIMPLVEFVHLKAQTPITNDVVMQIEFLILMFATLFCTVPMLINKDFQVRHIIIFSIHKTQTLLHDDEMISSSIL